MLFRGSEPQELEEEEQGGGGGGGPGVRGGGGGGGRAPGAGGGNERHGAHLLTPLCGGGVHVVEGGGHG